MENKQNKTNRTKQNDADTSLALGRGEGDVGGAAETAAAMGATHDAKACPNKYKEIPKDSRTGFVCGTGNLSAPLQTVFMSRRHVAALMR